MTGIINAFLAGWQSGGHAKRNDVNKEAKKLRNNLSESQVDDMVDDSFPASDPPSNY